MQEQANISQATLQSRELLKMSPRGFLRSNNVIRILIADAHSIVLDGLRSAIEREVDLSVVGQAQDGLDAVNQFRNCRPDVTLLDLQMARMNGLEATEAIRKIDSHARIVILTNYCGDVQATKALKAGALGYLLKSSIGEDLIATIRTVVSGNRRISDEVASHIAANLSTDWLSDREVEILRGAANGRANKCIAGALGITENTVKGHMRNIMSKLRANDRTHAVMIALRRGFLDA